LELFGRRIAAAKPVGAPDAGTDAAPRRRKDRPA